MHFGVKDNLINGDSRGRPAKMREMSPVERNLLAKSDAFVCDTPAARRVPVAMATDVEAHTWQKHRQMHQKGLQGVGGWGGRGGRRDSLIVRGCFQSIRRFLASLPLWSMCDVPVNVNRCWSNAGPPSQTAAQHYPNIGSMYHVYYYQTPPITWVVV